MIPSKIIITNPARETTETVLAIIRIFLGPCGEHNYRDIKDTEKDRLAKNEEKAK